MIKDTGDRELVHLLSWTEVIDALQAGLPEYYMAYPTNDKSITFDHVELTYAILKDGEDTGKFMYTPVWVFTEWDRYSYDEDSIEVAPVQIIMVNAVNGSIVDIKEEALNYEKYIVNSYYYSAE